MAFRTSFRNVTQLNCDRVKETRSFNSNSTACLTITLLNEGRLTLSVTGLSVFCGNFPAGLSNSINFC
jgi:hypothetical protein